MANVPERDQGEVKWWWGKKVQFPFCNTQLVHFLSYKLDHVTNGLVTVYKREVRSQNDAQSKCSHKCNLKQLQAQDRKRVEIVILQINHLSSWTFKVELQVSYVSFANYFIVMKANDQYCHNFYNTFIFSALMRIHWFGKDTSTEVSEYEFST